ncbi:hypothetical protein A1O3_04978 [Capronia epimyces CBS 606.96]|uniref:Uncharacterized protein n=1 Tax=Capronia epimyces CBS 606.96 TaxID=1182542 RepID=W9Y512_9EURO|nr:uncharacterized protein A1O3_04978 [Capronia epimyces CBS 606.96]EXJ84311.1 hypothetical protein A1O3_04978 [Capronia epimyces CBS 606.96]
MSEVVHNGPNKSQSGAQKLAHARAVNGPDTKGDINGHGDGGGLRSLSQSADSPVHHDKSPQQRKKTGCCEASDQIRQQALATPGLGCSRSVAIVGYQRPASCHSSGRRALTKRELQEAILLPIRAVDILGQDLPVEAIQDTGSKVSMMVDWMAEEWGGEITTLDKPKKLTALGNITIESSRVARIPIKTPCWLETEPPVVIKFYLFPEHKLPYEAFLGLQDTADLGHVIIVHCIACANSKAHTG